MPDASALYEQIQSIDRELENLDDEAVVECAALIEERRGAVEILSRCSDPAILQAVAGSTAHMIERFTGMRLRVLAGIDQASRARSFAQAFATPTEPASSYLG